MGGDWDLPGELISEADTHTEDQHEKPNNQADWLKWVVPVVTTNQWTVNLDPREVSLLTTSRVAKEPSQNCDKGPYIKFRGKGMNFVELLFRA